MEEIIRLQDYQPLWEEWSIGQLLYEGNLANVYAVKNTITDTEAVVKVISIPKVQSETRSSTSAAGENKDTMSGFFKEVVDVLVTELEKIDCLNEIPNVLGYKKFEAFERREELGYDLILLMERKQGLIDYVAERDITNEDIVRIIQEVAWILKQAHANRIVHKDIKVENIFLNENGESMLADFALARKIESYQSRSQKKTDSIYIAPEVLSEYDYDVLTDIYALGMVLYLLLNDGNIPPEILKRSFQKEVPKPLRASEALSEVVLKAISYRAKDRYQSAEEFYQVLSSLTTKDLEFSEEYKHIEEERLRREEEARITEEERLRKEAEERQAEEERLRREEEARIAEEERLRKEAEERQAEEERLKREEEARIAEEERLRKEAEERQAEEERLRREEEARIAEEERLRKEAAERQTEEERLRREEAKRLEEERQKEVLRQEAEAQRRKLAEERMQKERAEKMEALALKNANLFEEESLKGAYVGLENAIDHMEKATKEAIEKTEKFEPEYKIHADAAEYSGFFDFTKESYAEQKKKEVVYDKTMDEEPFEQRVTEFPKEQRSMKPFLAVAMLAIIVGVVVYAHQDEKIHNSIVKMYNEMCTYIADQFSEDIVSNGMPNE